MALVGGEGGGINNPMALHLIVHGVSRRSAQVREYSWPSPSSSEEESQYSHEPRDVDAEVHLDSVLPL